MSEGRNQFRRVENHPERDGRPVRPALTYWQDARRRLRRNKASMIGLALLFVIVLLSVIGPHLSGYSYRTTDFVTGEVPPDGQHWFGTDALGRDLWTRVWMGGRISLLIGFVSAVVQSLIGVTVGGIAGFFGKKADMLIMRFIDVMIAIPFLIFVILIMVFVGTGVAPLILAIALTGWLRMARLVRGQVMQLKDQEFILAARSLGASTSRLIFRHLIPNTMGVIIVTMTMSIPDAIFTEAFLSFLGIGVQPPQISWGQLANTGALVMETKVYQLVLPSIFISLTMLSLNLLGDGLRDALDPRLRK